MTTIAKNKDFRLLFVALALCCIGLVGIALVFFNENVKNYEASMVEYTKLPKRKVLKGDEK